MTFYHYKAATTQGEIYKGCLEASTEREVGIRLRGEGLELIACREDFQILKRGKKIRLSQILEMSLHMEQMEQANIPLLTSLRELALSQPALRGILQTVIEDVEGGLLFSQSLKKNPLVFDPIFIGLVQAGEKTGQLGESFRQIYAHLLWVQEIEDQIKQALRYPLLMVGLLTFSLCLLLHFVVPSLVQLFLSLGQELPVITECLYELSLFIESYGLFCLLGLIGLISLGYLSIEKNPNIASIWWKLTFRFPVVGAIQRDLSYARFSHYLAHLCGHGVDLLEALRSAAEAVVHPVLKPQFECVLEKVYEGRSLSKALSDVRVFPPLVIRMVAVGEQTGNLAPMLGHVQHHFDRKAKLRIRFMMTYLEPTLLCIAGLFLTLIVYSIFWPLYDLLSFVEL